MSETAAVTADIELADLDWDDQRFVVHRFVGDEQLRASLDRVGMLQPPWVWGLGSHRYVVVDGFKRLQWARKTGCEAVSCRIFPADAGYECLWRLRLEGKLCSVPLNAAEKAQLIAKAAEVLPRQYLADALLPALGLAPRSEVADPWRRLSRAGDALLRSLAEGTLGERAALALAGWQEGEREAMLALLRAVRPSASIQMEMLERIAEIALRRGQPRLAVLTEPQVQAILHDHRGNRREKMHLLRELLTRWRFPRLHAREERFARDVKALPLPGRVRLLPPPAFEGEDWRLEFTFAGPEELLELLKRTQPNILGDDLAALMAPGAGDGKRMAASRS